MPAHTQTEYGLNSFSFRSLFFARQRNAMSFTTNYDPVTANFNLCTQRTQRAHLHQIADLFAFSALGFISLCFYPTIFNYANIHPLYLNYHFSLSYCELLNRSLHFVSSTIFALFLFIFSPSIYFAFVPHFCFFSMLVLLA